MNERVFDFALELHGPKRSKTFSLFVLRAEDAKTELLAPAVSARCTRMKLLCEITRKNQIVCLINIPKQAWPVKGIPAISQQVVWFWSQRPHTTSSAEKWQIYAGKCLNFELSARNLGASFAARRKPTDVNKGTCVGARTHKKASARLTSLLL